MPENSDPIISKITTLVLFPGVIVTAFMYGLFGIAIWLGWGVCIGVLFLCEFMFGRRKKRFYKNIGALIGTVIMAGLFVLSLTTDIANVPESENDLFIIPKTYYCMIFLPPMTASLGANIGNIIYKLRLGKTEKPRERQPR